ncbi:unnamed protein product [Symbiodinium natans]|uniref:GCN5-related N-acetyltransferase Rv2170-like domain-containing protein n=1 Tax=Symbiodinium natans TaxID=878477 RepID=A0A812QU01_9DINO|nr:unnamed protein product [Symbiodinium natans]
MADRHARFLLPFGEEEQEHIDWHGAQPRPHHRHVPGLPEAAQAVEHRRPGKQLLKKGSFHAPCAQDELQLFVALETPEQAARLRKQAAELDSGMGGMQEILLDQFIEKDYGDDLLLLTATEQPGGRLVGLIFWRYLHSAHDDFWRHVLVDLGKAEDLHPIGEQSRGAPPDAWILVELLCTDDSFRKRGVGKLLLVAALAYSTVKDGKTAAVLTLGRGEANEPAVELYRPRGVKADLKAVSSGC